MQTFQQTSSVSTDTVGVNYQKYTLNNLHNIFPGTCLLVGMSINGAATLSIADSYGFDWQQVTQITGAGSSGDPATVTTAVFYAIIPDDFPSTTSFTITPQANISGVISTTMQLLDGVDPVNPLAGFTTAQANGGTSMPMAPPAGVNQGVTYNYVFMAATTYPLASAVVSQPSGFTTDVAKSPVTNTNNGILSYYVSNATGFTLDPTMTLPGTTGGDSVSVAVWMNTSSAPRFVQAASPAGVLTTAGLSVSTTINNVKNGDFLFCVLQFQYTGTPSGITFTDSQGNTVSAITTGGPVVSGSGSYLAVAWIVGATAGTHTITASWSTTSLKAQLQVLEYTNVDNVVGLDVKNAAVVNTTAIPVSMAAITPKYVNGLLIDVLSDVGTTVSYADNSSTWTSRVMTHSPSDLFITDSTAPGSLASITTASTAFKVSSGAATAGVQMQFLFRALGAPGRIQSVKGSIGTASTLNLNLTGTPAVGDTITLAIAYGGAQQTLTVSDNVPGSPNTYTQVGVGSNAANTLTIEYWTAVINGTQSTITIHVAQPNAYLMEVIATQYTRLLGSLGFQTNQGTTSPASNPGIFPSIGTTSPGFTYGANIFLGMVVLNNTTAYTFPAVTNWLKLQTISYVAGTSENAEVMEQWADSSSSAVGFSQTTPAVPWLAALGNWGAYPNSEHLVRSYEYDQSFSIGTDGVSRGFRRLFGSSDTTLFSLFADVFSKLYGFNRSLTDTPATFSDSAQRGWVRAAFDLVLWAGDSAARGFGRPISESQYALFSDSAQRGWGRFIADTFAIASESVNFGYRRVPSEVFSFSDSALRGFRRALSESEYSLFSDVEQRGWARAAVDSFNSLFGESLTASKLRIVRIAETFAFNDVPGPLTPVATDNLFGLFSDSVLAQRTIYRRLRDLLPATSDSAAQPTKLWNRIFGWR